MTFKLKYLLKLKSTSKSVKENGKNGYLLNLHLNIP